MSDIKKPAVCLIAAIAAICTIAAVCLLSKSQEIPHADDEITIAEETPENEENTGEILETVFSKAQSALDELYDCGILANRFELDMAQLNYNGTVSKGTQINSFNERTVPSSFCVSCGTADGDWVYMILDAETRKVYQFSIDAAPREGDPQLDFKPIDMGNGLMYYHDSFSYIIREDMTLDELCRLLCDYWSFTGYTISGTQYFDYGYDTEAPDSSTPIKDFMNQAFVTVYFDGDEAGMPIFIEGVYFPASTHISFGIGHAVG